MDIAPDVTEQIQMTPLGSTLDLVRKVDGSVNEDATVTELRDDNEERAQALPPVDGGKEAWLFLASCYLLEVSSSPCHYCCSIRRLIRSTRITSLQLMCFGPAFSWSVFQDYLQRSEHSPLRNESTVTISAIGTLLFSMLYFAPALARPFFWLHPTYARLAMRVCLGVAIVALVGASFATNASILIGLVGLVCGLACGIMTSKLYIYIQVIILWTDWRPTSAQRLISCGCLNGSSNAADSQWESPSAEPVSAVSSSPSYSAPRSKTSAWHGHSGSGHCPSWSALDPL